MANTFLLYRTSLQLKAAGVSITTLMLQPLRPAGASYLVARSTKEIHVGSRVSNLELKVEILSVRVVSTLRCETH